MVVSPYVTNSCWLVAWGNFGPTRSKRSSRACRPRRHHGRDHPDGLLRQRRDDARLLRRAGRRDRHGAPRRSHCEGHVTPCGWVVSLERTAPGGAGSPGGLPPSITVEGAVMTSNALVDARG